MEISVPCKKMYRYAIKTFIKKKHLKYVFLGGPEFHNRETGVKKLLITFFN